MYSPGDDGQTEDPARPTSVYGSLTDFFTGGAHAEDDNDDGEQPGGKAPHKAFVKRKRRVRGDRNKEDHSNAEPPKPAADPWFADSGRSKATKPVVSADWFDSGAVRGGAGIAQRSVKDPDDGTGERIDGKDSDAEKPRRIRRRRRRVKKTHDSDE